MKGKITDANSGDPIPYVNVIFGGTTTGITSDFDGNYELKSSEPVDTIVVSYIGYRVRKKAISRGISQIVNIQLEEDVTTLQEIVFEAGENPAFEVLRNVVRNKKNNDKRKLTAYEYDTYTKIEIDVDNLSDKFRQRKMVKKITQVLDSIEVIAGEDGKPVLPLLITESVSKVYYRDNPSLKYEHILRSKVNGVGVEDGTTVTQLVGSSFQEYNFYQNWLNILAKDFVSPIADGWRLYYEYDLIECDKFKHSMSGIRKVFIDNGLVQSRQAENFEFNPIVEQVASNHPEIEFIVTHAFYTKISNIHFTSEITKVAKFDLNEVAYLSLCCDVLIGRNSGPHVFTQNRTNCSSADKKLLSFTYHPQGASFVVNTPVEIKKLWSAATKKDEVITVIEEAL